MSTSGESTLGSTHLRIDYLDGIRAMAIVAVLVVHWLGSQVPAGLGGYIGVDIFFVLSGYIITTILWRSRSQQSIHRQWGRFILRRVRRLYPALLGMIVGTLLLFALVPGAPIGLEDLFPMAGLAIVQGYSFFAAAQLGPLGPFAVTWSLAVEWMFYLLWPVAVFTAKRSGVSARGLAAWSAGFAIVVYALALGQGDHWFYYGPVARVPEIIAGGVLALVVVSGGPVSETRGGRPRLFGALTVASIIAVAGYTVLAPVQWSPVFRFVGVPIAVAATCTLIWAGHRYADLPAFRLLSARPLAFVGRTSYSLYLWHAVPLAVLTRETMPGAPLPVLAAIGVASALIFASIIYRFLELPYMKSKARAFQPGAPHQAEPAHRPR